MAPMHVHIIGLGLVGGSLAAALSRSAEFQVSGSSPHAEGAAREKGWISEVSGPADIVVLCMPLPALESVLASADWPNSATVTDVIGVKVAVRDTVTKHIEATRFVGSHPMAGGVQGGIEHARADLFEGRPVAVCTNTGDSNHRERVEAMWRACGANVVNTTAEEHDAQVALTSHLPYVNARLLRQMAGPRTALVGRGFEDATRHADFAPQVMGSVCGNNKELPAVMRAFAKQLQETADAIDSDSNYLASEL